MIPLIHRIRKETHRKIAAAQDLIVQEMYSVFNDAVFHGGTVIWRCYHGNRFSEDIDVYLVRDMAKINLFFARLERRGFTVKRKKISQNSIYSLLALDRTEVRFEAVFKKAEGILGEYEAIDSNIITVNVLSPEQLISEKTDAFLKRRKARDIYDIFFLIRHLDDLAKVRRKLKQLLKDAKRPDDEKELRVLILEGLVPTYDKMIDYIKRKV